MPLPAWPVTTALGLATVIFIGGGLNLANLARPAAFDVIIVAGVVFALIGAAPAMRGRSGARAGALLASLPLLAAGGFVTLCLVPPSAYNVHDDFEKYFALPVRMLATGTLAPNPLGSVGAETLGAQAFLQAFVVAHLPIKYIGACDGLFCLLLCLALVAFDLPPGRWGIGAAAAAVCAWLINPQVVNISSVFSGAALIATAVLLSARVASSDATARSGLLMGIVYAGLIALKTTFVVFAGVHLLSLFVAGWWLGVRRSAPALWAAGGTVVGLAPWVLLHLPLYLAPAQPPVVTPPPVAEGLGLFSRELGYGEAPLPYTLLAIAVLAGAVFFALASRRGRMPGSGALALAGAAGLAAGMTYVLFMVVGGPMAFGRFGATRYACPVLIGVVPAMMRLVESRETKHPLVLQFGLAGFALAVAALFWPSTVERPRQWWRDRTPLAFLALAPPAPRQAYLEYNRLVFEDDARKNLQRIQELVPAGEPLGAWVSTSFLLDFHRNPVLTTDPAGLNMRWARWPAGLRYFLIQYKGYGVRSEADYREEWHYPDRIARPTVMRSLAFLKELQRRAASAAILYNDGAYLLMRTEASTAATKGNAGPTGGSP